MSISAHKLAQAIVDCEHYKILRQAGNPQKSQKKIDLLIRDLSQLAFEFKRGERVDSDLFAKLIQRIDSIARHHDGDVQELLLAKERLEQSFYFPKRELVQSKMLPPLYPSSKGGICNFLVRALFTQGSIGLLPASLSRASAEGAGGADLICERGFNPTLGASHSLVNGTSAAQCYRLRDIEYGLQQCAQPFSSLLPPAPEGCGNKHRNLIIMQQLVEMVRAPMPMIPSARCLPHDWVLEYLEKNAPQIFEHWKALEKLKAMYSDSKPFLENAEVLEHLQAIDREIATVFDRIPLPLHVERWLVEQRKQNHYIMVRSSGAEDGKLTANAGGNTSPPYVPPESKDVRIAAGIVVRSYFGIRSLQNRLNANGNPFAEPLSLAVTLQQLIGEPVGGSAYPEEIPISFVLFTNEPLFVGKEKFRVMTLSAAYGHGEAVVGNQGIATDTITILLSESQPDELYILYDNAEKSKRLAPVQKDGIVRLGEVDNPLALRMRPALSRQQIRDIYQSGLLMEAFFNGPTDIEGVVQRNRVYFVQARPIIRKQLLPTYLDADFHSEAILKSVQAEALVLGKASVVTIERAEDVLFASSLEEAEKSFRGQKLVVVSHPEPKNSHPTVNFSTLGVPCLYAPMAESLRDSISSGHPLVVCMQKATLVLWDRAQGSIEEHIKEGFAVHPAKIAISLSVAKFPDLIPAAAPADLKELFAKLRDAISPQEALKILDRIQNHPLLRKLQTAVCPIHSEHELIQERIDVVGQIIESLMRGFRETRAALRSPQGRMHELIHIKALEAIVLGMPETKGNHYCLLDVPSLLDSIEQMAEYQSKLGFPAHCLALLLDGRINNPEAFESWQQFLLDIEPLIHDGTITPAQLNQFKDMLAILRKNLALPMWLTMLRTQKPADTYFSWYHWQDHETAKSRFRDALAQISSSDLPLLQELQNKRDFFESRAQQMSRFADPRGFSQAWKELRTVIEECASPAWLIRLKSSSPFVRSVAYQVLGSAIEHLNLAILTLQPSTLFDNDASKIQHYKEMVLSFYQLMRHLAIDLATEDRIFGDSRSCLRIPMLSYLDEIQKILIELPTDDPAQLQASDGFSVSAAMLGFGAPAGSFFPKTLEDALTLCHQNALLCINAVNQDLFSFEDVGQSFFPKDVKEAIAYIEKTPWYRMMSLLSWMSNNIKIQRQGVQINDREIILFYNIPLRDHSSRFEIHYDLVSRQILFKGQFIGMGFNRWETIAKAAQLLIDKQIFKESLDHPSQIFKDAEMTFYWSFDFQHLKAALSAFDAMLRCSMNGSDTLKFLLRDIIFSSQMNRCSDYFEKLKERPS